MHPSAFKSAQRYATSETFSLCRVHIVSSDWLTLPSPHTKGCDHGVVRLNHGSCDWLLQASLHPRGLRPAVSPCAARHGQTVGLAVPRQCAECGVARLSFAHGGAAARNVGRRPVHGVPLGNTRHSALGGTRHLALGTRNALSHHRYTQVRALVGHRKVFVLLQRLDPKSPTCLEPLRPRTLRSIAREPHGP